MYSPEVTKGCVGKRKMKLIRFDWMKETILSLFQRWCGIFCAFLVTVASTGLNIFSHVGGKMLHPINITLWSSVIMVSLSGVFVLITRPVTPNGTQYGILIAACGLLTGCGSLSFVQGVILSNPADAVSLYFTLPIIVIILESFIKCKRVKMLHLLFTTCSFVGVAVVSQPFTTLKEQSYLNILGIILGLAAGIFHACSFIIVQKLKEVPAHPLILCLATSSTMFAVSLGIGTFLQRLAIPRSFDEILVLSAVGFLHFTANAFAFLALRFERPYIVSVIMTFEVIFTFIAQWIFLNVTPSWHSATGGFLISAACIGVALTKDEDTSRDDREEQRLVTE